MQIYNVSYSVIYCFHAKIWKFNFFVKIFLLSVTPIFAKFSFYIVHFIVFRKKFVLKLFTSKSFPIVNH